MIEFIDPCSDSVLIAVCSTATGHCIGGLQRLADKSLYAWCDVEGQGRISIASIQMPADGEAALDELLDRAIETSALDLSATNTFYAPELLHGRRFS